MQPHGVVAKMLSKSLFKKTGDAILRSESSHLVLDILEYNFG